VIVLNLFTSAAVIVAIFVFILRLKNSIKINYELQIINYAKIHIIFNS
jgi:hypothetical protein